MWYVIKQATDGCFNDVFNTAVFCFRCSHVRSKYNNKATIAVEKFGLHKTANKTFVTSLVTN